MSVLSIIRWARQQRTGDRTAKAVLMVLASHTDRDGIAMLAARTIAEEAEISESAVRKIGVPALVARGLVDYKPGRGRANSRYRLLVGDPVVRPLQSAPRHPRSADRTSAQDGLFGADPGIRTTEQVDEEPSERCADSDIRCAYSRPSDQHRQSPEVEEEVQEEVAAPPLRAPATRPRIRASGGSEHVPPAELHRTAAGGQAFVIVSAWAKRNPGVRNGARRELAKAVDKLLHQGDVLADLVPAALDEAHGPRWRNPAAALPMAYDDVRRRAHPPARAAPVNAGDAAIHAFLNGPTTTTPRAIGGPA